MGADLVAQQPSDVCQRIVTMCDNGNWTEATIDGDCGEAPQDQFLEETQGTTDAMVAPMDGRDLGMSLDTEPVSDAGLEQWPSDADSGERVNGSLPVGRASSRGQGCAVSPATSTSPLLTFLGGVAISVFLLLGGGGRRSLPLA